MSFSPSIKETYPHMKTLIVSTSVVVAAAALTAACSSATSPAKVSATHPPRPAPASTPGTEIFTGNVTGKAALVSPPAFTLRYTGPVTTTGTFSPDGGPAPKPGQMHPFPTKDGTLELTVTSVPETSKLSYIGAKSACDVADTTIVNAKIDGATSTGKFTGATGTAQVDVGFSGKMPKLKDGACNMSQNATPSVATARAWVTGTITLTLKK
jgi:hypothetical protein